jgi:hypothetical protein
VCLKERKRESYKKEKRIEREEGKKRGGTLSCCGFCRAHGWWSIRGQPSGYGSESRSFFGPSAAHTCYCVEDREERAFPLDAICPPTYLDHFFGILGSHETHSMRSNGSVLGAQYLC